MSDQPEGKIARKTSLAQAFSPSAPVGDKELFAGRADQITDCLTALTQSGLHIAIYGERGVGKTSLANVLPKWISELNVPSLRAIRVDCNSDDDHASLWRKIFRDLREPWRDEVDGPIDPESVRFRLQDADSDYLIVIDELDRLEDDEALSLLADTVKTLSDHTVATTLALVGVAASVDLLIGEHESIVRCLTQVYMPRMTGRELRIILEQGYDKAGMGIEPSAGDSIVRLAEGLPHFVHLLGLAAGKAAIDDDRTEVTEDDVRRAIRAEARSHTLMSAYRRATHSPQPGHLFEEVLIACALAPKDQLGYFRASAVVEPLSAVLGRKIAIPNFSRHLNEFCTDERGNVLQKEGSSHRYRYRFRDPLLQPFAKMTGISSGIITAAILEQFPDGTPEEPSLEWPP